MLLVSQPDFALRIASRYITVVSGIPTPAEMTLLAPWQSPQEQAPRKTVYAAVVQDVYNITRYLQYNTVLNLHLHLRFLGRMLSGQVRDFSQANTQILRMLEKNIVLQKTGNRVILQKTETLRVTQPLAALRRAAAMPVGDAAGLFVQNLFAATPGAAAVFFPGDAEIVHMAQRIFSQSAIGETAIPGGFRPGGLHGADIIFPAARTGDIPPRSIPGAEEPGGAVRAGILPLEIAHAAQPGRPQIPPARRDPSAHGAEKSAASGEAKNRERAAAPLPVLPPAPYRAWDTVAVPLGMGRADLPYTQMLGARPAVMVYRERQEGSPERQPAQDAFLPGGGSFVRVSPLQGISTASGAFLPIAGEHMPRGGISAGDVLFAARVSMLTAPARNIPEGSPTAVLPPVFSSALSQPVASGTRAPAFMQPLLPTRAMVALPQAEWPAAPRHALPPVEASADLPQRERQALLFDSNTARVPQRPEPAFVAGTFTPVPAMVLRNRQLTESPPGREVAMGQAAAETRYREEKKAPTPGSRAATPRTFPAAPLGKERLPPEPKLFRPAARLMPQQGANAPRISAHRNLPIANEAAARGRAAVLPGRKTPPPVPEAAATYLINSPMAAGKQIFARYAATAAIPSNPAMVYAKTPGRGRTEVQPGADNGADIEFIRAEKKPARHAVQAETNRQEVTRGATQTVSAGAGAPLSAMPPPAELEKPLNEIADKVYRLLERRLRSEQMRKGLL